MREMENRYKFRGICDDLIAPEEIRGKFIYGSLIIVPDKDEDYTEVSIKSYDSCSSFLVDEKTVGEYIGRTDSIGVEIYGKDIIKTINGIGTVEYDDRIAGYMLQYFDDAGCSTFQDLFELGIWLEKIGNSYEGITARRCRKCGCTHSHGCEGGCYWVEDDLCSTCFKEL